MSKPAHILNSIKKIVRDLEQLHADVTTFDFGKPQAVINGSEKLDCLNEWMKESCNDTILTVRVGETTVQGNLDYDILEKDGDWIWQVKGIQFSVDDVDWIDPDWGIIQLLREWEGEPS